MADQLILHLWSKILLEISSSDSLSTQKGARDNCSSLTQNNLVWREKKTWDAGSTRNLATLKTGWPNQFFSRLTFLKINLKIKYFLKHFVERQSLRLATKFIPTVMRLETNQHKAGSKGRSAGSRLTTFSPRDITPPVTGEFIKLNIFPCDG